MCLLDQEKRHELRPIRSDFWYTFSLKWWEFGILFHKKWEEFSILFSMAHKEKWKGLVGTLLRVS